MHDLGDLAVAAGLAEPVLDVDRIRVSFADVGSLVRDLRACGAVNAAGGRRRGLTGRALWRGFERGLEGERVAGRIEVTVELILGQAWGLPTRGRARGTGDGEAAVAVEELRGRRRR